MKTKSLAFAPVTKRLGVAVFENAELIYFAVATVKSSKIIQKLKIKISETVRKLIEKFEPDFIVVKTLNKQQKKSKNLRLAVRQIISEAGTAGVLVEKSSFEQAKQKLCAGKKPIKANAFLALTEVYPELRRLTKFQNRAQAEYYNSLLSAVAVGFHFQSKTAKSSDNTPHEIKL